MTLSLLFPKRFIQPLEKSDLIYDPERQINMVRVGSGLSPAIDQPMMLPTNSKTMQAPGDDDPDADNEQLY